MPLSNYKASDFYVTERKYLRYSVSSRTLLDLGLKQRWIDEIKAEIFNKDIKMQYPTGFIRDPRITNRIPVPDGTFTNRIFVIDDMETAGIPVGELDVVMAVPGTGRTVLNQAIEDHGYRDLAHYYSGCFGIHVVNGEVKVFYCDGFRDEGDDVSISYRYIDNGQIQGINRSPFTDEFSFPLPKTGYFNLDKFAIFSERSYKKDNSTKYRKGYCYNHLTYTSVSIDEIYQSKLVNNYNPYDYPLQDYVFKVAEPVLVNTLPPFQEALNKVTSFEMLSCAFTSTLCIKLDAMYNRFVLLKNTWTIGEYNLETKRFIMFTPIFNNELRNLNIEYEDAL